MFLRSARHMAIPGISTNDREQRQLLRVTPRLIDTRAVKIVGRDSVSNLGRFPSVEDRRNARKKRKKGVRCILLALESLAVSPHEKQDRRSELLGIDFCVRYLHFGVRCCGAGECAFGVGG